MIDREKFIIDKDSQPCALMYYAISANYFARIPKDLCFFAYCEHFKLKHYGKYEYAKGLCDAHFPTEMLKEKSASEVIEELHNLSGEKVFELARNIFNIEYIENVTDLYREPYNSNFSNIPIMSWAFVKGSSHAIGISKDKNGFYRVDIEEDDGNQIIDIEVHLDDLLKKSKYEDAIILSSKA